MKNNIAHKKIYSWKFWLVFWLAAVIFLFAFYILLQIKNKHIDRLKPFLNIIPIGQERRKELGVIADIYQTIASSSDEKIFLVLFQNNLELRPGGGFLGSFGVVKISAGKVASLAVYDTGVFDNNVPNTETPPAPLAQILGKPAWKMRDSNWSPDFETNARYAEYFYHLGGGKENIDGVIGINTDVLNSILSITGPVKIDDYPGEYNDETAILQLEYQVEKGFEEQGIEKGERKSIMNDLATILIGKMRNFRFSQQLELAGKLEEHLKEKDIQLFFNDDGLEKKAESVGWDGNVKKSDGDYLMVVDANLNSLKSDYCIKRNISYAVDLSSDVPTANLEITYENICRAKDWMTTDYRDWLRVYAPEDSNLLAASGQNGDVSVSDELGKKVFGMLLYVPIGQKKTITLKYQLPNIIAQNPYNLFLQKQSGSGEENLEISLKKNDGNVAKINENFANDRNISL